MKKNILIAEDDPGIIDAMQIILEDAGYAVKATADATSIAEMEKALPDLLILDLWMSGVNGKDVCMAMKSQDHTKHIPIIICSANKDVKKIALECGAEDFLAKPFEMKDLLDKVARLVQ